MVCTCLKSRTLSDRSLSQIPLVQHPEAARFLAYVLQRWFFEILIGSNSFELRIAEWPGLPRQCQNCEGDGHDQLLRALIHKDAKYIIYEVNPPIYEWTWEPSNLSNCIESLIPTAFHCASIASDFSVGQVKIHDQNERDKFQSLYERRLFKPNQSEIEVIQSFLNSPSHESDDHQLLELCPYLVSFFSPVVPGRSDLGECDLIFTDALQRVWCVVEVKYIDNLRNGKTVQVRRTQNRKEVKEQAIANRKRVFHQWKMPDRSPWGSVLADQPNSSNSSVPSMMVVLAGSLTNESAFKWATEADRLIADAVLNYQKKTRPATNIPPKEEEVKISQPKSNADDTFPRKRAIAAGGIGLAVLCGALLFAAASQSQPIAPRNQFSLRSLFSTLIVSILVCFFYLFFP